MIRRCAEADFEAILATIDDGARAYRGVIPADRWHQPYMPADELRGEIAAGVEFWAFEDEGGLVGVMGIQPVRDVVLIRHAYVATARQRQGIGGALLGHLLAASDRPFLIGTWAAADWAARFYVKHDFAVVTREEKDRLLRQYWNIPERQVETSVVLADARWRQRERAGA